MKTVILALVLGAAFSAFGETADDLGLGPDLEIWARKGRSFRASPTPDNEAASIALGDLIAATKLIDMKKDEFEKLKKANGLESYTTADRKQALRKVAVDRELISREETGYIMTSSNLDILIPQIEMIRGYNTSLQDTPKLKELEKFPSFAATKEALERNRRLRDQVSAEKPGARFSEQQAIDAWISENARLMKIWEELYEAQAPTYALVIRRPAAKRLKALIGAENFAKGIMPSATAALPGEKK